MTVVVVAGVKGAGGVSTAALTLAAMNATGVSTVLVEADPSGGSLLGWCEQLDPGSDLYDLASSRDVDGWWGGCQRLGEMLVLPARGTPFRMEQALARPRVGWRALFDAFDGVVFVDVGRVYPSAPTWELLTSADVVVLVSPAEPGPVAATLQWASQSGRYGRDDVGVMIDRLRMVSIEVVGRRREMSASTRDILSVTGPGYVGHLPHDPTSVDLLCRGASVDHKSMRRSGLVAAARSIPALLVDPSRIGVVG